MSDLTIELDADAEEITDTPARLMVNVGDGLGNEEVRFDLFGPTGVWINILTDNLDQWGMLPAGVPIPAVPAGEYTLYVVGETSTTASLDFIVHAEPLDEDPDVDEHEPPGLPTWVGGQHRWQFIDTSVTDNVGTYEMVRNPSRWTNPNRPNYLEHDVTTAPDGNVLAWEGAERSWAFEFSGYLDTKEEYDALLFWSNLRRRFWLIDHRDKARYVTFEHFDAKARIVPGKPWAHDYTIRVVHFYRQDLSGGS